MKRKTLLRILKGLDAERLNMRIYTQDKLFWILWRYFKLRDNERAWLDRKSYLIAKRGIVSMLEKEEPELIEDFRRTFFKSPKQFRKWKRGDIRDAKKISEEQLELVKDIVHRR